MPQQNTQKPAAPVNYKLKYIFAALPRTQRARRLCIKGDPKGKYMLYSHGKGVIIRNVENPIESDVYTQHSQDVTSACYAPSGNYICSGDKHGKVRIWDTMSIEHPLKAEYQPLGGEITDICWSPDSKRLAIGGSGRGLFAHAFLMDTGTGVGKLIGHSKTVNSIDYKSSRPFRIVTASEDYTVGYFEGPPFKIKSSNKDHTNFVNIARFSPNGELYISGSSDGRLFLYDAKTSEKIKEVGPDKAHKGGIYDVAWGPDNKHVLTASGDKTAKIFDVDENKCTVEFTFGDSIDHQQLACAWIGDNLITVELSGYINYLDRENPSQPKKVLKGHNKNITSLALSEDKKKIYTGSYDGQIYVWDPTTGMCEPIAGQRHSNQVSRMATCGSQVYTISMDDSLMSFSTEKDEYTGDSVSFDSEPKFLSAGKDGLAVVSCVDQTVVVIRNGKKISSKKFDCELSAVAVHTNQTEVAIANASVGEIYIHSLDNDTIGELKHTAKTAREPSVMQYSPDGAFLAVGLADRNIVVFNSTDYSVKESGWAHHSSRVTCLAWTSDSLYFASGSLDSNVIVWAIGKQQRVMIRAAHSLSSVVGVAWLNDNQLVSTATDCSVKVWDITHV